MPSTRQSILALVIGRLQAIAIADGFQTDAGATVMLGETPTTGDADPPAVISILPGEEDVQLKQGKLVVTRWPVEVHCLAHADQDSPWDSIEAMVSDVLQAMELDDMLLNGDMKFSCGAPFTKALPREVGSRAVGAIVTYTFTFGRVWGTP